jgi:hypothetical protein
VAAHASAASLILPAAGGEIVISPEMTKWNVPLIGDAETQGCWELPVACITASPISLKVWKRSRPALRMVRARGHWCKGCDPHRRRWQPDGRGRCGAVLLRRPRVRVGGSNYLVPANANPTREATCLQAVDTSLVLAPMELRRLLLRWVRSAVASARPDTAHALAARARNGR